METEISVTVGHEEIREVFTADEIDDFLETDKLPNWYWGKRLRNFIVCEEEIAVMLKGKIMEGRNDG